MNFKLIVLTCLALVAAFALSAEANGTLPLMTADASPMMRHDRMMTGASCQLYGHSCLGGHGKRSDSSVADVNADAAVNQFQARLAAQRMSNLVQRLLARRITPDLVAAYVGAASGDQTDMDKNSQDYMQS